MKATGKDAFNLIRHWKDEASEGPGFRLTGRVAELSDSVLSITGTACEALIPLDGVSYDYHGSQHIPSALEKSPDRARHGFKREPGAWGTGRERV